MQFLGSLVRRRWLLLLLSALVLPACVTGRQARVTTVKHPAVVQEIPSYGGVRRVAVSVSEQKLRAYDGGQLVFETRVSTGMEGKRTPTGSFSAQSKDLIHYSSLYENAPMPFSVQFHGNYFIHGFSFVPHYPASHGCIRLPLREDGHCPAEEFYDWVRVGTPIRVVGSWQDKS
jgi:lipoprotein-anchoring transpeptidase ErfK/SrfK